MTSSTRLFIVLILLALSSCICKDMVISNTTLNDIELELIELNGAENLTYVDQDGNNYTATAVYEPISNERDQVGPEVCEYYNYQFKETTLFFPNDDVINFFLKVESGSPSGSVFIADMRGTNSDDTYESYRPSYFAQDGFQDSDFTTITIEGFTFDDSILLTNLFSDPDGAVVVISINRGVEFALFPDGSYLKLI